MCVCVCLLCFPYKILGCLSARVFLFLVFFVAAKQWKLERNKIIKLRKQDEREEITKKKLHSEERKECIKGAREERQCSG